jgi:hypothetical protein
LFLSRAQSSLKSDERERDLISVFSLFSSSSRLERARARLSIDGFFSR